MKTDLIKPSSSAAIFTKTDNAKSTHGGIGVVLRAAGRTLKTIGIKYGFQVYLVAIIGSLFMGPVMGTHLFIIIAALLIAIPIIGLLGAFMMDIVEDIYNMFRREYDQIIKEQQDDT